MEREKEMNSVKRLSLILLLVGMVLIAAGCVATKSGTFVGEKKSLGNGMVRSWVTLDNDGKPLAVGVTFSEASLSGLPAVNSTEYTLALPQQASAMPFNHIAVNWNPKGHIPPGIYDVPHFDAHFYLISMEERKGITATGEDMVKITKNISSDFIPDGYVAAPGGGEPMQGAHWIDPAAPEFNGQRFTKTFIYGFYDGKMIFMEPMVTKAFLETKPNTTDNIKLPSRYPKSAYYPARYVVKYDATAKEYTVSLEEITLRK